MSFFTIKIKHTYHHYVPIQYHYVPIQYHFVSLLNNHLLLWEFIALALLNFSLANYNL